MIDLTGEVFGKWIVLERALSTKRSQPRWLCRCVCGIEKVLYGHALRSGDTTQCVECRRRGRTLDLTQQVFGELTAIEQVGSHNGARWLCHCTCGAECVVARAHLRSGHTTSCGHLRRRGSTTSHGYRLVKMHDHPNARKNGYISEHTLVMSEMLGRPLIAGENVHHKNLQRMDNRPENLELWYSSQPKGARVEDLIEYIARYHTDAIIDRISEITAKDLCHSVMDPIDPEFAT